MPAAEDSGGAIGAAYYGLWRLIGKNSQVALRLDSLGKTYSEAEISHAISAAPCVEIVRLDKDVLETVVDYVCEGAIVGWFMGGSELGPRALGHRSILCDPRIPDAKRRLNERVKHREDFRPFAPIILREEVENWFEGDANKHGSPFMLRVCKFKPGVEEKVPAVAHVDHTGRLQTVTRSDNGTLYDLIKLFYGRTGVPIILNTSLMSWANLS